ncbi:MAG TPA: ABC transporter permease [Candidatus Limnocylindrales bacterium]
MARLDSASHAVPRPGFIGRRTQAVGRLAGGVTAIGVKELRGRMRGWRAFLILTAYLALLSVFSWMVESLMEGNVRNNFGAATYASAQIGQGLFVALLGLVLLHVLVLAPTSTAGSISLEREKQTLDLLVTTPISSLAIVLGKLLSALTYVFLLIVASIPMTSIVFVFGGAGPEDLVRGYAVLLATALGLGSVGLFCSALVRRTGAATILTFVAVLALTLGATFIWVFLSATDPSRSRTVTNADGSVTQTFNPPPEAILWFNPFVALSDVYCGTETGYGTFCGIVSSVTGKQISGGFGGGVIQPPIAKPMPAVGGAFVGAPVDIGDIPPDVVVNGIAAGPTQDFGPPRDSYWPRSVLAWIGLSIVLVLLSVQLVSPTRRWRLPLTGRGRRVSLAATTVVAPAGGPAVTAAQPTTAVPPAAESAAGREPGSTSDTES